VFTIRVHDARAGRDGRLADPETGMGELLLTFRRDRPYNLGDKLWLPDGSVVEVVGVAERWYEDAAEQDLSVGDVFDMGIA
jgi:hypothetical protein